MEREALKIPVVELLVANGNRVNHQIKRKYNIQVVICILVK